MKKTNTAAAGATLPALAPEVKAKIAKRAQIQEWLKTGKSEEMELRTELATLFVPTPREGTNNVQGQGFAVKLTHKVTRTLDEAALDAVMPQLPEHLRIVGHLISYKPVFSMDVYRTLTDDERKIFDQALTIKDGAPELEIIVSEESRAAIETTAGSHDLGSRALAGDRFPRDVAGAIIGHVMSVPDPAKGVQLPPVDSQTYKLEPARLAPNTRKKKQPAKPAAKKPAQRKRR